MHIKDNITKTIQANLNTGSSLSRTDVTTFKGDYSLRTYTSGCYFYSRNAKAWIADGTEVSNLDGCKKSIFKMLMTLS